MRKDLIAQARKLVPPLLPHFHKGQLGRVLVVGGSEDYTGAPYFSCAASALVGADMSHILCTEGAATVIKSYSPNLMVHPYLRENIKTPLPQKARDLLTRMHVVVVGPGLGRDPALLEQISTLLKDIREREIPLVVDADGLWLVQQQISLIRGWKSPVILTPNVVEFARLVRAAELDEKDDRTQLAEKLASTLGVTLLVKGPSDLVTNGKTTMDNDSEGSNRRVSGQGDTLSGTLATFMAWSQAYKDHLWDTEPVSTDLTILAAMAASTVTRLASKKAYQENGRAMVTTDVTSHVGPAFHDIFE